jgi:hypothetical protein
MEADLQLASVACMQLPVTAFIQQAPSFAGGGVQKAHELSARQVLPWPLQLLCRTFFVQVPAAQQEPCCAGVALQVDAAQLKVVEKLPRQASAVVSLHAPILGLQQAPCKKRGSSSSRYSARLLHVLESIHMHSHCHNIHAVLLTLQHARCSVAARHGLGASGISRDKLAQQPAAGLA